MNQFRIGFLIDHEHTMPAWQFRTLHELLNASFIEQVVLIVVPQRKPDKKRSLAFRAFNSFEKWWFKPSINALEPIELDSSILTRTTPIINLEHDQQSIDSRNKLKDLRLDVIYDSIFSGANMSEFTKFGHWCIQFDEGNCDLRDLAGFWEVMKDEPVIASNLNIKLADETENITVYRGVTTTVPFSVLNTVNSLFWKASSYLVHRIRELSILSPVRFFIKYKNGDEHQSPPSRRFPGSLEMVFLFCRNALRYAIYKIKKHLLKRRFRLFFKLSGIDPTRFSVTNIQPLPLPKDVFWADPFVVSADDKHHIFFEEFSYPENKAHISVLTIDANGKHSEPQIVMNANYHLSYPFVFEFQGSHYMIPETSSNKTVEVWTAKKFPYQWEFVMNLMHDTILIDATLLYHNNKWWLFGTSQNHPGASGNDQLFLYFSDNLFSDKWEAHPQNPIVTDISNCRPAGKIFTYDYKLLRPAQNNASKHYGYGVCINEIEILNEYDYKEKIVLRILPGINNKLSAIHTLNAGPAITVIDGYY